MKLSLETQRHTPACKLLKEISLLQVDRYSDKDPGPKIMVIIFFFILKRKKIPILFLTPVDSYFETCISAKVKHRALSYFLKNVKIRASDQ